MEIQLKIYKVNTLLSLLWDTVHSHHRTAIEFQLNKDSEGEFCRVSGAQTVAWEKIQVRREFQVSKSCPVTQTAAVFVPLIILKRKTRKQQQPNTGQLQQCALHGLFFLPRPLSVLSLLYFRLQIALLAGKSQPRCSCEIIPGISALPGQVECFFFFILHCGTLSLGSSCPPFLPAVL